MSKKFKVLDDLSEETFDKQSEIKQGDQPHLETMEIDSQMGYESTKDKH